MKDLTLLLLLKDREDFSKRWLSYFERSKMNISVFVADGSKKKTSLFDDNKFFEYKYFGPDKNFNTYRSKVIGALEKINTKYVLFASNDDFYIKNGLVKALKKLKSDKNYSAARGLIKTFSVNSPNGLYGKLIVKDTLYKKGSILSNKPHERILEFTKKSNGIWHDIVKRDDILDAWKISKRSRFDNIIIHDLFTFLFICSRGKCLRAGYIFMLHQDHKNRMGLKSEYSDTEILIGKILSRTSMGKKFIKSITKLSKFKNKIQLKEFENKFINLFYSEYLFQRIENKHMFEKSKTFLTKIKFYLTQKFVLLYTIYLYFKFITNHKNKKNISKLKLNLIDDFLAKKI